MNRTATHYREAARQFAERAARELNGEIQAVVLYGSVARGEATRASDIDLLIVTPRPDAIRARVVEIEEEIDARHQYGTFLTATYMTLEEVRERARLGSPHLLNVLAEGMVLYDDGSFTRLRQEVPAAGRPDAGRRTAHAPASPAQVSG